MWMVIHDTPDDYWEHYYYLKENLTEWTANPYEVAVFEHKKEAETAAFNMVTANPKALGNVIARKVTKAEYPILFKYNIAKLRRKFGHEQVRNREA